MYDDQPILAADFAVRRVGPYELTKTLGVGSTGRVKLGIHKETMFKVAVKIISKQALKVDKDLQEKIEREIAIMKLINHPHVLTLYDVYESDENLFLVLEHVEGGELFDYLVDRGRLPEMEALAFFQQIISAIDFCHHHYICHRDLKPENLLLDSNNNIKIADFGMASLQLKGAFLATSCGSPHYASPEVVRGEKYDGKAADVWSCGVILFALLTGCLPFDDEDIQILLTKVKAGNFKIPEYVPQSAQSLIRRLIVVNPNRRLTMEEIKNHPWFKSNELYLNLVEPPTFDHLPPITRANQVDEDVIQSISRLGCFHNRDAICLKLTEQAGNLEKMLYYLLLERKATRPSVEDNPNHVFPVGEGPKARKRTDSCISLEQFEPLLLQRSRSDMDFDLPSINSPRRMSLFRSITGDTTGPHSTNRKEKFNRTNSYSHSEGGVKQGKSATAMFSQSPRHQSPRAQRKLSVPHLIGTGSMPNLDLTRRASASNLRLQTPPATQPSPQKKSIFGNFFAATPQTRNNIAMKTNKDVLTLSVELPKILQVNYISCKQLSNIPNLSYKCKYESVEGEKVKFKITACTDQESMMEESLVTFTLLNGSEIFFQSLAENIFRGLRLVSK